MKPRKVLGFGALKHRERPATHNVGLVGVSCCGALWLSTGHVTVAIRCECGEILEVTCVEPESEALYQDDDEVDAGGWLG